MMKKLLLLSLMCILGFFCQAFAQNRTVTGKVISAEDNSPLPGVNVTVKGTSNGTSTGVEGTYSLTVSDGATLVFSFVGYTPQEIIVGNQSVINVNLVGDVRVLTDVVVVGYGTTEKANLTGNIAQVSGASIQNTPVTTVEQAIQGKAAGVFVESNNGKLGQGVKIRVRGSSSVSADNQPLYVIDGIPITSQSQATSTSDTNPLADLNFNDVESIDILKDASASAIYGARASNGVVLITTKRGKSGKTNFNLNYQTGTSKPTGKKEWLNTKEYVQYFTEAALNSGLTEEEIFETFDFLAGGVRERWQNPSSPNYVDEDWQGQAFQKGSISQLDFSANGGNDKTRFYASGSYSDQKGILIRNSFKRVSGRLNLDHKATDKLTLGINFNLARTLNGRLADDNAFSTPLQIVALTPFTPIIDPSTKKLSTGYTLYYNPLLNRDYSTNQTTVFRNFGNVYGSYDIFSGLKFRTEYGYDLLNQNEERYYGKETAENSGAPNGLAQSTWVQVFNFTTNNVFQYNKTIQDTHTIDATLGMSYQESNDKYTFSEGQQFPSSSYKHINASADITGGSSTVSKFTFLSYFARANYQFKGKYLFGLSGRIDGSSRFGANNRYGFFPAVSAGWILSEESFMKNISAISFLKLRASYGLTGNAEIGNFPSRALYSAQNAGGQPAGYSGTPGQRPLQIDNPDLKWEQTAQTDIGLEFGVLQNRISVEADYYVKKTKDLLLNVNIPATSGFSTQLKNVGKLENRGFEFVLNTKNLVGDVQWSTSFNMARNQNKITDLQGQVITAGYLNRAIEGQSIGVFFGPEYAGVDPANGDALYYLNTTLSDGSLDRNTTNNVNDATRVVIGNPNPNWIGGITNNISFKGIELSFMFQGVFGNKIYNGGGKFQSASGDYFDNQTKDQLNGWKKPGDITNIPQARLYGGNGTAESSRYLSDGSYVRLKTLTLGYSLPSSIISKVKLSKVRVYVNANNLLTFTKYKGWDPEVNTDYLASNISQGNDFYSAPQPKTVTVGINLGF